MSNLTDFLPGAMAKATQAQAEAGAADNVVMTPLAVKRYVDKQKGAPNGVASLGGDGKILPSQSSAMGVDQSWQMFTTGRALNVSYYNATERPIFLFIDVRTSGSVDRNAAVHVSSDNISWTRITQVAPTGGTFQTSLSGIILPNQYYKVSGDQLFAWSELR